MTSPPPEACSASPPEMDEYRLGHGLGLEWERGQELKVKKLALPFHPRCSYYIGLVEVSVIVYDWLDYGSPPLLRDIAVPMGDALTAPDRCLSEASATLRVANAFPV